MLGFHTFIEYTTYVAPKSKNPQKGLEKFPLQK